MEPQVVQNQTISGQDHQKLKIFLFIIGILILSILTPVSLFLYKQRVLTKTPATNPSTGISFSCPVKKEACSTGEVVSLTSTKPQFLGLAYRELASGSAVLAVIPGKYTIGGTTGKNGDKIAFLSIKNLKLNIQVDYQFKGQVYIPAGVGEGDVNQGETIGWLSTGLLDKGLFENRHQLIVSIRDLKTKEFIKLEAKQLIIATL